MHATKIDLPAAKRDALVKSLNQELATLIDLQTQAKQAHWNVRGPHFISLHELFDKVAEEVEDFIDTTAERVGALGGAAEGTLAHALKHTKLNAYPEDIVDGNAHVAALSTAVAAAAKLSRAGIDYANEHGDQASADLFTEITRGLDKQLWFLETHLQGTH